MMAYAALMHWLLGQAISTIETIYTDPEHGVEHSIYFVGILVKLPIFDDADIEKGHLRRVSDLPVDDLHGSDDSGMLVGFHLHSRGIYSSDVRIDSGLLCFDFGAH